MINAQNSEVIFTEYSVCPPATSHDAELALNFDQNVIKIEIGLKLFPKETYC